MRIFAIGLSATSITSAPARRERLGGRHAARATSNERGGSISTAIDEDSGASVEPRRAGSTHGRAGGDGDHVARFTGAARGTRDLVKTAAIARVCAGPVPQHPPITDDPFVQADRVRAPPGTRAWPGTRIEPPTCVRTSGVRARHERERPGRRSHGADHAQHLRRTLAAVRPDRVDAQLDQALGDVRQARSPAACDRPS